MLQTQKKEQPELIVSDESSIENKAFSFQNFQNPSLINLYLSNKENLNSSSMLDYEYLLESTKINKDLISDKNQDITQLPKNLSKETIELNQIENRKNVLMNKLKISKSNHFEKVEENELLSDRFYNQRFIKCISTTKKNNINEEKENLRIINKKCDFYEPNLQNQDCSQKELILNLQANTKLVEDYRKQIILLEKNFENQKNQHNEINEYRKLINNFEEKINLLIDDNQRLVNLVETDKEELAIFKEKSDDMLKKYQDKVQNLEKENKFKEDRYNEVILCLDTYKYELDKFKDFKIINERERTKVTKENKANNLKILELEKNEENVKNENNIINTRLKNIEIEAKEAKMKKDSLENNVKELLKKNQFLNKELNERIGEVNNVKKELEKVKEEKLSENEKNHLQLQQMKMQYETVKEQKEKELRNMKLEFNNIQEKFNFNEKNNIKNELLINELENNLKRYENSFNEQEQRNEKIKKELILSQANFDKIHKENIQIVQEKDKLLQEFLLLQKNNQDFIKTNGDLKTRLQQLNYENQTHMEKYNKQTENLRIFELNEISNNYEKKILAKSKIINEIMIKNKELIKEIEIIRESKEDYKQKLMKMDLNYTKAMKELQIAYEQEKNIKNKNFEKNMSEFKNVLMEKDKLIQIFTKEKEELLIILRKTTGELYNNSSIYYEKKKMKQLIEEKENENNILKRGLSLKNNIRNHSAEREYDCNRKPRLSLEYRRSLHMLSENNNLENDINRNYKLQY